MNQQAFLTLPHPYLSSEVFRLPPIIVDDRGRAYDLLELLRSTGNKFRVPEYDEFPQANRRKS